MNMWQFALCGALGGVLVEVLALFGCLVKWQASRRTPSGRVKSRPPRFESFVDLPVHLSMLVLRPGLGAAAATLFASSGQITGPYVAVALGFTAPAILSQLGSVPQIERAVKGARTGVARASNPTEIEAPHRVDMEGQQRVTSGQDGQESDQ
jgi:hypothetical protein